MSVKLHASARKHQVNQGLTDGGVVLAAEFPLWVEPLDDEDPQRELRLGFDDGGRLLEPDSATYVQSAVIDLVASADRKDLDGNDVVVDKRKDSVGADAVTPFT